MYVFLVKNCYVDGAALGNVSAAGQAVQVVDEIG
jgi:hypothetical protein